MIRLAPEFMDLVLKGSVDLTNRDMLELTHHQVLHINDKLAFTLPDTMHHLLEMPIERSVRNAGINNVQVAMIKHLLFNFSALTIEHYTPLNRMFISRIRNGTYAKNIQPIPCTLKQLIDYAGGQDIYKNNDFKFTLKGSVLLLHKYGVSNDDIASEFNIRFDTVKKIIADSKFIK